MIFEEQMEISIHALLAESDPALLIPRMDRRYFYPRSPCGERHGSYHGGIDTVHISIHALLAESDFRVHLCKHLDPCISIHALLAESDSHSGNLFYKALQFLSTLSLRRATPLAKVRHCEGYIFLSTLSLRRATRWARSRRRPSSNFYPRSPCGERLMLPVLRCLKRYFYPRSPCGERLRAPSQRLYLHNISIHALLAESD